MKLQGKLSLNKLMHNDRLMILFSLVAAIAIWAVIINGQSQEHTRIISNVPVSVTLTNQTAQDNGLRVINTGTGQRTVKVKVKGRRWQLVGLTTDDIVARAQTGDILTPGEKTVLITVEKSDPNAAFEIEAETYEPITIFCDYWVDNREFPIHVSADRVTVSDTEKYRLGTPTVDTETQTLTLSGPKSIVDKIAEIRAVVEKEEAISKSTVYSAEIQAFDNDGKKIEDLVKCDVDRKTVTITVPVLEHRTVNFTYSLKNVPPVLTANPSFVTLSPSSIELWAPGDVIDERAEALQSLGTFDFDNMTMEDSSMVIPLALDQSVMVEDGTTAVEVRFDIQGYTSRTLDMTLILNQTLTILNAPAAREISIPKPSMTGIRLFGPAAVLDSLDPMNLMVTVDMAGVTASGPSRYEARVTVKNRSDIWTYYGEDKHGYELYITVN